MRNLFFVACGVVLAGCGNTVTVLSGAGGGNGAAGTSNQQTTAASGTKGSSGSAGTPCSFLHGSVTLDAWDGSDSSYAAACFSFRLASNDIKVTKNEVDVLYDQNHFTVNTVVDDQSFIVDLGDVPLANVPSMVSPDAYPTGTFGKHDAIDAVLGHTYFVRTTDNSARSVAAFRVTGLSPGNNVTIEWEESTDPDQMVVPKQCLP